MAETEVVQEPGTLGPLADDLASTAFSLARRFAAGATMWCGAPSWPAHARHVAVEFVHPVIVGKRALPAAAVGGSRMADELRVLTKPGDIFVGVAQSGDAQVSDVMRRSRAWGLTTVWIGAGVRPPAGAADHVLFVDGDEKAAYSGRLVLLYHLLWELTHVCFEHPGLLGEPECSDEVCVTCSDEGRLAEVITVGPGSLLQVRTARGREAVEGGLIDEPRPGDLVLVHGGCVVTLLEGTPP